MCEPQSFRIMVTDANHHIRDFLKRELEHEGYTVFCVSSGTEVCKFIRESGRFDLVVLDPELLFPYHQSLLWEVVKQNSSSQIIIHTYDELPYELKSVENIQVVEKNASSIGVLKEKVRKCYTSMAGS